MTLILPPSNPILKQAFDADWYFPPSLPQEITSHRLYEQAVEEGWHEWIETELDFTAVKRGYKYDLSRDFDGKPAYWIDGHWQLHDGSIVPVEDEADVIGYIGRGDHMMRFCETFMYFTKAPRIGQPYRFLPWMRKVVAPLFGWVITKENTETRIRRFKYLLLELGKKNGKSSLISTISDYMLIADEEPKAEVYICACDRNQARIIYNEAANFVRESPPLSDLVDIIDSRSWLFYREQGSYLRVLSADAYRNDGIDSSFTAIDEIHRHPNRKLFDVMERAGKARPQRLTAVITTYGPSTTDGSIWAELHNEGKAQFAGERPDNWQRMYVCASAEPIQVTACATVEAGATHIPVLRVEQPIDVGTLEFDISAYTEEGTKAKVEIVEPVKRFQTYLKVKPVEVEIPIYSEATANEDWCTLHGVIRANPSADVIFPAQETLDSAKAVRSPQHEAETKQLDFNIVSGSGKRAISAAIWKANGERQVQPKKLIGKTAYAGMDFAFMHDLVALSISVPSWDVTKSFLEAHKPRIDLLTWGWVCEDGLDERSEKEKFPYRYYAEQPYLFDNLGCVRICPGRVVDYTQIVTEAFQIIQQFNVIALAYDPNWSQFGITRLGDMGVTCIEHKQGKGTMGPSTAQFLGMVSRLQVAHGHNPLLDRAVEGAVLDRPDANNNRKFSKGDSKTRIDPLIAHVMSVGFATNPPIEQSGAWSGEAGSGMYDD